jgi:hypothetical protein
VDLTGGATLSYGDRGVVSLNWSIACETQEETTFIGTKGRIKIHAPAHCPTDVTVTYKLHGRGDVYHKKDGAELLTISSRQLIRRKGKYSYSNGHR